MKVKFTKMQGCGNDYIYIYGPDMPEWRELPGERKAGLVDERPAFWAGRRRGNLDSSGARDSGCGGFRDGDV